jgi:hypothetical protein
MIAFLYDTPPLLVELTLAVAPLLGQSSKSYNWSWAIVLGLVILGLLVTLSPARRTSEVKKRKIE